MSFTLKIPNKKTSIKFFFNLPKHLKGIDKYLNENDVSVHKLRCVHFNDVIYLHELKFKKKIVSTTFISVKVLST